VKPIVALVKLLGAWTFSSPVLSTISKAVHEDRELSDEEVELLQADIQLAADIQMIGQGVDREKLN
jgi:phosphate/sulfate permease